MNIAKGIGWMLLASYFLFIGTFICLGNMGLHTPTGNSLPPPWWWQWPHQLAAFVCINRSMTLLWTKP